MDLTTEDLLEKAAKHGDTIAMKRLIEQNETDLETKNRYGWTALTLAAQKGHEDIVRLLLNHDQVNPESRDKCHRTPLMWAAHFGHEAIIKLLLDVGKVDVNAVDEHGQTSISRAAQYGHDAAVKLLLNSAQISPDLGNDDGQTPLLFAAENGHDGVVKLLMQDRRVDPNSKNDHGRTPLSLAAKHGHCGVTKLLLDDRRVDPNSRDGHGRTPLWWAIENQRKEVIKALLKITEVDAEMTEKTSGRTLLSYAAQNGHENVVQLLLDSKRVDPDSKDQFGLTPLMWALDSGHKSVVQLLHDRGGVTMPVDAIPGLEIDSRCLAHWIKACDKQHGEYCQAKPMQTRLPHQTPDWVIDILNGCLVAGSSVTRYIALSYVWNNQKSEEVSIQAERLMLKRSNLPQFQKPGFLDENVIKSLPVAVSDTITLLQKLGERYLWVDCLCIVQDDEKTREQIDHMDDVYSGAYLTVIAATSSRLSTKRKSTIKDERRSSGLELSPSEYTEVLYRGLLNSRWATRGWTFQEQILSRRAVIFVDGYVFWDCQRSVWDKGGLSPDAMKSTGTSFSTPFAEMACRMSMISWPDFAMYIELVTQYNFRSLTYPQDALPAISGILNTLHRGFTSGFVGGLPRLFLDVALLWQPFTKATRRIAREGGSTATCGNLPSWSWVGWNCQIDPSSLRTGLAYLHDKVYRSRISSWRTQPLVRWSAMTKNMEQEHQIEETSLFTKYQELSNCTDTTLPYGWSRYAEHGLNSSSKTGSVYFMHESDSTARFRYPIPIDDSTHFSQLANDTYPYLSCETTHAFLKIGSVLIPRGGLCDFAIMKTSVFDLPQFSRAPMKNEVCQVLTLEDAYGEQAGSLQGMDNTEITGGEEIELIAISSGSVNYEDLDSAFQEAVDRHQMWRYPSTSTEFWRVLPGASRNPSWEERRGNASISYLINPMLESNVSNERTDHYQKRHVSRAHKQMTGVYHFYNVLWIERDGDIAYRRAAGRVPKAIWDKSCTGPVKVILG
jgi:ankyrin repeat protein